MSCGHVVTWSEALALHRARKAVLPMHAWPCMGLWQCPMHCDPDPRVQQHAWRRARTQHEGTLVQPHECKHGKYRQSVRACTAGPSAPRCHPQPSLTGCLLGEAQLPPGSSTPYLSYCGSTGAKWKASLQQPRSQPPVCASEQRRRRGASGPTEAVITTIERTCPHAPLSPGRPAARCSAAQLRWVHRAEPHAAAPCSTGAGPAHPCPCPCLCPGE